MIIASGSNGVRDVFEEIFAPESLEPVDPTVAARRHMRALKRRFNEDVTVRDDSAGFAVALGGRPIRTPARRTPAPPNFSSRSRKLTQTRELRQNPGPEPAFLLINHGKNKRSRSETRTTKI